MDTLFEYRKCCRQDWLYIWDERLGMLCGSAEPTAEQLAIAEKDADEYILSLKP